MKNVSAAATAGAPFAVSATATVPAADTTDAELTVSPYVGAT